MLVLTLADFNATREMGPILALGVAVMVAAGLTLLPAILATLGRRAFWPAVPQVESEAAPVGGAVAAGRAPRRRAPGGDGERRDPDPRSRGRSAASAGASSWTSPRRSARPRNRSPASS